MIAAPPPHPHGHSGGHDHGQHRYHGRPSYPYGGIYGGQLQCVEIPNPVAGAVPPLVWVSPLTGAACTPYLATPYELSAYV